MPKLFVLMTMVFFHIVDDYYLQGILASLKQKSWWTKNAPNKLYRFDYIVALVMHSFSWAFMVMLPIAVLHHMNPPGLFYLCFAANAVIHALVDHAKANMGKINLVTDQALHLAQIVATFLILLNK